MLPGEESPLSGTQVRPEYLVRGTIRLVVLPDIFIRLNLMVDDPDSSTAAIAALIGQDPALSARLLKLANSPFYSHGQHIGSLPRAVTMIGVRGLRDLVLATATCDLFNRFTAAGFDRRRFWRHSLRCGLTARLLGMHHGISEAEGLFVAGLLHDIGQLVILDKLPEMAREMQWRAQEGGHALHLLERSVIGCDHADVGAELLRQWRLPESICEPIACHHDPTRALRMPLSAAIIHYADVMAHELPDVPMAAPAAVLEAIAAQVAAPIQDLMDLDAHRLQEIHDEILFQGEVVSELLGAA